MCLIRTMSQFFDPFLWVDTWMSGVVDHKTVCEELHKLRKSDERAISCHHAFNIKKLVEAVKVFRDGGSGAALDFEIERAMGLVRTDCTLSKHEANEALDFAVLQIQEPFSHPDRKWMIAIAERVSEERGANLPQMVDAILTDPWKFAEDFSGSLKDSQYQRLRRLGGADDIPRV
jgi:hypothetical protein